MPFDFGPIRDKPARRDYVALLQYLNARLMALETERYSWWLHWRELADYILPRRYKWLITPNQYNKGSPVNQRIIDETGTIAFRVLAAGMMSGICSPSRPWFRMKLQNDALNEAAGVKVWLDEVGKRMATVMQSSNYYSAKATQFQDLGVFGTAPLVIYEGTGDGALIQCFNPAAGEYYCANGPDFSVDTLFRKFTMTCAQVVREYGIENVSESVKQAVTRASAGHDREIVVGHAIEPNPTFGGASTDGVPAHFRFREVFWEWAGASGKVLRIQGFVEQPFGCPRWDLISNDSYGRSPAMDALPSIKQLQLESKRKAQAIDKMVNPPMNAAPELKNAPASLLPGAVNFIANPETAFRPTFQVNFPVQYVTADIQDVRERIKETAFNDLFMMFQDQDPNTTATQISEMKSEKLTQLGPVLERFETEGLGPDIERIYGIMARRGLLPPPPAAIRGQDIKVEYDSMLSQMQRAASSGSLERLWATVGNLAGLLPQALDLLNVDEGIEEYADMLGTSPKVLNDKQTIQQMRDARAKQQQAAAQQQQAAALAQGAQVMSQTPVGGGANALQAVLGGAGS